MTEHPDENLSAGICGLSGWLGARQGPQIRGNGICGLWGWLGARQGPQIPESYRAMPVVVLMCSGSSSVALPVLVVPLGSNIKMAAPSTDAGLCSTPRGTT